MKEENKLKIPENLEQLLAAVVCLEDDDDTSVVKEIITEKILSCVLSTTDDNIRSLLNEAVKNEYLIVSQNDESDFNNNNSCNSSTTTNASPNYYSISSDEIKLLVKKQVLYDTKLLHEMYQQNGRRLLRTNLNNRLAISQYMKAESSLNSLSQSSTVQIVSVCLEIGTEAAKQSQFDYAAKILNFGTRLLSSNNNCQLQRHCWRDEYNLLLTLFTSSVDANHCVSQYEQAEWGIQQVQANARCFHDQITVLCSKVFILGLRGERDAAIDVGLSILQQIGYPMKSHPSKLYIILQHLRLQSKLNRKSPQAILRMSEMNEDNDEMAIVAMKVLNLVYPLAFTARPMLMPLIIMEMIKVTIDHGVSVMSSVGFATYGMMLCGWGDYKNGLLYGNLGLDLYERLPVKQWLPRVYAALYGGVYAALKNPALGLDKSIEAYEVGLQTGDTEFALVNGHIISYTMFSCGYRLSAIETTVTQYHREAKSRNQTWIQQAFDTGLQFIHNLMGKAYSNDPKMLIGEYFNEESKTDGITELDDIFSKFAHMYKMKLSYMFGDYSTAVQESILCIGIEDYPTGHVYFTYAVVFHALSVIALCRQTGRGKRKTIRTAQRWIRRLEIRAKLMPIQCSGKLFLLQAELAWLRGDIESIYFHFMNSIACSAKSNIPFDQGLAHERLGRYFLCQGDETNAMEQFQAAVKAYESMDASAKVKHLREEMEKRFSK